MVQYAQVEYVPVVYVQTILVRVVHQNRVQLIWWLHKRLKQLLEHCAIRVVVQVMQRSVVQPVFATMNVKRMILLLKHVSVKKWERFVLMDCVNTVRVQMTLVQTVHQNHVQ